MYNDIKIEDIVNNVRVYGLAESILGSKYPKSVNTDGFTSSVDSINDAIREFINEDTELSDSKDLKRAKLLGTVPTGSGHDNFLKGIVVQFDLTFTVKAWTEAERYHFLDFVSSQSTMHCITKFDLDKQYIKYVDSRIVDIMREKVDLYNNILSSLDKENRDTEELKDLYLEILYSNPTGFKLTARMTTNYQQLKTIYYQRKTHRLPEWRVFCSWVESLPLFKEICMVGDKS